MTREHAVLFAVVLIVVVMSLIGCHPSNGKPVIDEEKMENILYEYYQINSTIGLKGLPNGVDRNTYYYELLKRYDVTEAEFDSALVWYTQNLDVWEGVYNKVYDRLSAKKDSLMKAMATDAQSQAEARADSLAADSLKADSLAVDSLKVDSLKMDSLKADSAVKSK